MTSAASEATSPLLSQFPSSTKPPKPSRNVTFNPQVSTSSRRAENPAFPRQPPVPPALSPLPSSRVAMALPQPMLSALNSKLRPRNSSGAPLQYMPQVPANKTGPQRTTRMSQELRLLPNPENDGEDEESGREAYSQFSRIMDPTARRDAARLEKDDRVKLPRVTA
ncbi:sporulation protein rmd1 [Friedmanniomyces endolithicus]|uniref:Sporulation protein rmd1 n=1 Tax=Friedmanniomyces endolithicus TaxID=329885 RepID=A0AAN6J062_9PEZI|nr:sporulation protein rmd1 [Friedmanniomyces endolithicus]